MLRQFKTIKLTEFDAILHCNVLWLILFSLELRVKLQLICYMVAPYLYKCLHNSTLPKKSINLHLSFVAGR